MITNCWCSMIKDKRDNPECICWTFSLHECLAEKLDEQQLQAQENRCRGQIDIFSRKTSKCLEVLLDSPMKELVRPYSDEVLEKLALEMGFASLEDANSASDKVRVFHRRNIKTEEEKEEEEREITFEEFMQSQSEIYQEAKRQEKEEARKTNRTFKEMLEEDDWQAVEELMMKQYDEPEDAPESWCSKILHKPDNYDFIKEYALTREQEEARILFLKSIAAQEYYGYWKEAFQEELEKRELKKDEDF